MRIEASLEMIRLADVEPETARALIASALRHSDPLRHQKIYEALRTWVWKTIDSKRRDDDLRVWHDLLKRTQGFMHRDDQETSRRIQVLSELIYESVRVSEALPAKTVLNRAHAKTILKMVAEAQGQKLERTEIAIRTGLQQANLTRVLNMLVAAGLLQKETYGKKAIFELTKAGEHSLHNKEELSASLTLSKFRKEAAPQQSERGHWTIESKIKNHFPPQEKKEFYSNSLNAIRYIKTIQESPVIGSIAIDFNTDSSDLNDKNREFVKLDYLSEQFDIQTPPKKYARSEIIS